MESNSGNEFSNQIQQNYQEAANRLAQAKSAVESQIVAYNNEKDPQKKEELKRILDREKGALRYADSQYNQARKALGK